MSASAIDTLSVALSMPLTVSFELMSLGSNASEVTFTACSISPNALLDNPIILIGVFISVLQNALLLKTLRLTTNGEVLTGASITLGT